MSYLGTSSEVRIAEPGGESAFLEGLRNVDRTSGPAVPRDSGDRSVRGTGFWAGWVVALGYEFGLGLLGVSPAQDAVGSVPVGSPGGGPAGSPHTPPAFALRVDVVLVINHDSGTAELRGESSQAIADWAGAHAELLAAPTRTALAGDGVHEGDSHGRPARSADAAGCLEGPDATRVYWRSNDAEYAAQVEACRRAMESGDAYVLCLTDTAEVPGRFNPLAVYAALRASGPAIRGGVIVAGARALVTASPERFLSVVGQTVRTHPIKGTRPRGGTPEADAQLAGELATDRKERAENLMIVDLMRNDFSRMCEPGTVEVSGFLRVETHTHVHQLVSTVSGRLRPGRDAVDAIGACFPGGSMTGAPKRSAVQILASLEAGPRGLYSGCFGWIDRDGDAELAMSIRGIELRGDLALIGAGGGITADSVAEREVAEKHLKAAPLIAALRASS